MSRAWDTTANLVINELARMDVLAIRINTEDFPVTAGITCSATRTSVTATLENGYGRSAESRDITAVYYRRPDPPAIDPAVSDPGWRKFAQGEARSTMSGFLRLLDHATWVNYPSRIAEAEHKLLQLQRASLIGLPLPETLVTNRPDRARSFASRTGEVIAKTIRSPWVRQDPPLSVYTRRLSPGDIAGLDAIAYAPCILQRRVDKRLDIRAVVVGRRVFTVAIDGRGLDDWRTADVLDLDHREHCLPSSLEAKLVELVSGLGLVYGAADLILTPEGDYVFLELNPNGEWGWLTSVLGSRIQAAIVGELSG